MKTGIDEIPNLLDELKAITAITSISHSIDFIGGKKHIKLLVSNSELKPFEMDRIIKVINSQRFFSWEITIIS